MAQSYVEISSSTQSRKLLKTLEVLLDKKDSRDKVKIHTCNIRQGFRKKSVGKGCTEHVKSCIVSHRFKAAAKLLAVMSQETCVVNTFLHKASMFILENLRDDSSDEKVLQFVRQIRRLKWVNKMEIVLEFLMYGLRNEVPDIQNSFQDLMIIKYKSHLRKNEVIDTLLKAYCGMFDYIEWCKSNTEDNLTSYGQNAAEKAINSFRECLKTPGHWDIFILKLVEMLESYGKLDEAEADLTKYIELNPEHLNAYIYICTFLNKYNPDSVELVQYLTVLVKLSPSDQNVLLLIKKWRKNDKKVKKMIKLLFKFLDYPSNSDSIEAWKHLAELLHYVSENCDRINELTMQACWRHRVDVWLFIHFRGCCLNIVTEQDCELAMYKTLVLIRFYDSHEFIDAVLEKVPAVSPIIFKNLNQKINFITKKRKNGC